MANEIPVIPTDMRKVYLRLKRWRSSHARRVPWRASLDIPKDAAPGPRLSNLHLQLGIETGRAGQGKRTGRGDRDFPKAR